jgi:glycosyltransferase involved in cell wall biosynthesis
VRIVQTVTLASDDGAFGGPLAVAIAQCRELVRRGHDVTLLAGWDGKLDLRIPGVRVVLSQGQRIPGAGFSGVRAPALLAWLSKNQLEIDLVHIHAGRHALDLELANRARRLGLPYVLQTHGMMMPHSGPIARVLDRTLTKPLLRAASAVLVLTEEEAAGIREIESTSRVQRVRNGLALVDRPAAHDSQSPEVLFLARLHPRKRVLAFAEMAKLLTEKGLEARFTVVGPDEGDLNGLEHFRRTHPDVPLVYEGTVSPGQGAARIALADVYVLPSHGEVFPVTVLESLAAGTAVVLTEDCGIAERLDAAEAASISDGTPDDLASRVEQLLSNSAERIRRAENGRALMAGDLGIEATTDEIETQYRAAIERKGRPNIVWVTNQAAPYRIPVWAALAEQVNLEIWLLESDRALHRDHNNRGADWEVRGREFNFTIRNVPTYAVRRGEARHYTAGWLGLNPFKNVDGVLIGGWDSPAFWTVARAAHRAGARRIGFYESHRLTQRNTSGLLAAARRRFFRSLDGIVVPGVAARDALLHEGIHPAKISVGFNAVDVERINAETKAERERHPRTDDDLRLLVVGQLVERKNVGEAIKALREPGLDRVSLTIVGIGPLETQLKKMVVDLGLTDRVRLVGYVPIADLPQIFAEHDVLVHPALQEVWGLVVNEALAAGLQAIVSDRCGVSPSVSGMPGVTVVAPAASEIAAAARPMRARQPIPTPTILKHDPRSFAQTFASALSLSTRPQPRSDTDFHHAASRTGGDRRWTSTNRAK